MPDLVLDYHRLKVPIDHPDASITPSKLQLNYLVLNPVTSDPSPLTSGMIWFRGDLKQLRYTPDGSTVYVIDPAPVVDNTWSDTTPHYFNSGSYTNYSGPSIIQLDQPAPGHKRSYEGNGTQLDYVYGWLLKQNMPISSRLNIVARVGAYHGYNATRANLRFVILDNNNLDKVKRNDSYPWVNIGWSMSGLGYSNGSYGNPLSGYIVFTNPPMYSFTPANPGVSYNMITNIPNGIYNILYGYQDSWEANWNQWASIQRGIDNTNFRFQVATKPPVPEVIRDVSKYMTANMVIAKWDNEVRLWIQRGSKGLIVPLGSNVAVNDMRVIQRQISINMFERIHRSGKEPDKRATVVRLSITTDITSRHKHSNKWHLYVIDYGDDSIDVAFGDSMWDGDKYGYYIYSFS